MHTLCPRRAGDCKMTFSLRRRALELATRESGDAQGSAAVRGVVGVRDSSCEGVSAGLLTCSADVAMAMLAWSIIAIVDNRHSAIVMVTWSRNVLYRS